MNRNVFLQKTAERVELTHSLNGTYFSVRSGLLPESGIKPDNELNINQF